jgi:hypothetical protein
LPCISAASPLAVNGLLVSHDGGYRFKGYLKVDRHAIADTTLYTARKIGKVLI